MIKFTNTIWLNVDSQDVARIDIDATTFENLTETAGYYVRITFHNGNEQMSDYFKTFEEARRCVENFIHALESDD